MKLPKSLTTVTPLSKFMALFLFLFLTLFGFFLGMQYQKNINNQDTIDPRLQIFSTKQACESFVNRKCIPTICETDPSHESCKDNDQKGWFATREPVDSPDSNTDISNQERDCTQYGGTWLEEHSECEGINKEQCSQLSGSFDDCASACRHDPEAELCIQMCVPVCSF